jgi:hypothetical protein
MPINQNELRAALKWGLVAAVRDLTLSYPGLGARLNDQKMIDLAASGRIDADSLKLWCRAYSVLRGPWSANAGVLQKLDAISKVLHTVYSTPGGIQPGLDAATRWDTAVEEVAKITDQNNRSLCAKAMWLYAPATVTPFDDYAQRSLAFILVALGRPAPGQDALSFFNAFEELYAVCFDLIRQVQFDYQAVTGQPAYPYPRRILDKALWFLSCPDRAAAARDLCAKAPWAKKFLPTPASFMQGVQVEELTD